MCLSLQMNVAVLSNDQTNHQSSEVGFKGICRKILIFMLVGVANVLDVYIIGTGRSSGQR
jgi:phage-related holin